VRPAEPAVCVVLHDVAPATWSACASLLRSIDALGRIPVTLLVVPEYHHGHAIDASPEFVRAIEARMVGGDEVAMHGCFHWDDVPVSTPLEWLRRRLYTRSEGEFGALGEEAAHARLARGLATFERLGWPLHGFVPPAWLLSPGARAALSASGFAYTSSRRCLYTLPDWRPHGGPSLVWSVRSRLRRRVFATLNRRLLRRQEAAPLLRLGLHPVDAHYPDVVAFWLNALRSALVTRVPMTKAAWLGIPYTC
jgi:predicted deacetylase